jgi:hypothetical protein
MTAREAAAELQCSISFVYKLMAQGQVAYECRGRGSCRWLSPWPNTAIAT